jgi:hypothetical protein
MSRGGGLSARLPFSLAGLACLAAILLAQPGAWAAEAWTTLAPGLELARFSAQEDGEVIDVLRIDPLRHDFALAAASQHGERALPMDDWAERLGLVAAINASMYLKDGLTSTGLMKTGEHVNQPRDNPRFGAYFFFGPQAEGLPGAVVADSTADDIEALSAQYDGVVQNFRLIDALGAVLWPETGWEGPVSCIGQDRHGNILFIHSRASLTVGQLGKRLMALPLALIRCMYVEGGQQAGLYIDLELLNGLEAPGFILWPIPNAIGVLRP